MTPELAKLSAFLIRSGYRVEIHYENWGRFVVDITKGSRHLHQVEHDYIDEALRLAVCKTGVYCGE